MREDVAALRSLVTTTSIDIITDMVTVIVMLVIMFSWHWKLTLLSLAVMPLIIGNYFFFIRRLRPIWRQWRDKWADISTGLYEAVAGAKVVKAFGRERHHERKTVPRYAYHLRMGNQGYTRSHSDATNFNVFSERLVEALCFRMAVISWCRGTSLSDQ